MRQVVAALLLGCVGFCIGGITAGATTLYLVGLGALIGAPAGLALGGWIGWRTPLRDATIIFACYFVVLGWAS
jgi:hypothetical protein